MRMTVGRMTVTMAAAAAGLLAATQSTVAHAEQTEGMEPTDQAEATEGTGGTEETEGSEGGGEQEVQEPETFTSEFTVDATPDMVVDAENQPVDGEEGATGTFGLRLNSDEEIICYDIEFSGVTEPFESSAETATHLHEAAEGEFGPPRVVFPDPQDQGDGTLVGSGCVQGPFTTGEEDAEAGTDTGEGFTVAQIEESPEDFYVDTHTADYPDGAVRGQLPAEESGSEEGSGGGGEGSGGEGSGGEGSGGEEGSGSEEGGGSGDGSGSEGDTGTEGGETGTEGGEEGGGSGDGSGSEGDTGTEGGDTGTEGGEGSGGGSGTEDGGGSTE
ncbi:CHRD domain-containing protein [Nocardiopsis sp. NPDC006832]|uniref:CHRD domain-containing protein n=1 Tax=Nocardiopsis sp. NPDC006832 TaxID=3157188 RepID=UPI0033E77043